MPVDLSQIKGCAFDAYGTLFDLGSALTGTLDTLGDKADQIATTWRQKQIEYTQLRSLMGRYTDFETITHDALCYALKSINREDPALVERLMAAYFELKPYADTRDTIIELSQLGYWCGIVSNGSPGMLQSAVNAARLNDTLDAILSVDAVGIFKPHPSTYQMAVAASNTEARRILFVSSNPWDIAGASTFGFRTAWINRTGTILENLPGTADIEIAKLSDVNSLLEKLAA